MKSVKTGIGIAIGIIVGFVLMCVLCGVLGSSSSSTPKTSTSPSIEKIEKDVELVESETNSPSSSDDYVVNVGDSIKVRDLEISYVGAEQFSYIEDDYYTDYPEDGNVFIAMYFDITNTSNQDKGMNFFWDFDYYADDYSVDNSSFTINKPKKGYENASEIAAGKSAKQYIVFEVPADYKKAEALYKELWTNNQKVAFTVTSDSITVIN